MERYNVPIAELSGLARVRPTADETEKLKFYGIGNADYNVARIRINASGDTGIQIEDIAYAIGKHTRDEFQWKAIAADGNDTVCMLSEKRGEIGCLDSDLHRTGIVSAWMSPSSCCGIWLWSTWNELCRF